MMTTIDIIVCSCLQSRPLRTFLGWQLARCENRERFLPLHTLLRNPSSGSKGHGRFRVEGYTIYNAQINSP
eukprot:6478546-Amphidinium_carterae.1